MKVLRIATTLLTTAVLVIGLGLVALIVIVPRVTGTIPLTVYTGSMEPTIATGAVVLIEPVDPATLRVGDVITYQVAPDVDEYITHRIVTVQPDTTPPSFITKGDNNAGEDLDPIPVGAVRGKVWIDVPYVGTAQQFVTGRAGIATMAVLAGLILLGTVLRRILRSDPEDRDPVDGDPVDGDPVDGDPVDGDPVDGDPERRSPGGTRETTAPRSGDPEATTVLPRVGHRS